MIKTSINTDYNNDFHDWNAIEHQIKMIAKAGFTNVQWIHDWEGEYLYSKSEMYQARDILRFYGLEANTIHATEGGIRHKIVNGKSVPIAKERCSSARKDYTSSNEYIRLAGVDLLKNRIELCSYIGAKAMVLHMQLPYGIFEKSKEDMEDYYKQVYKSFDEIQEFAKAAGVKIALENLLFTPIRYQLDKYDRMFNRYDEDFVGFCFDSGHASIMSQDNPYLFLEKYTDRLIATHLQDNDSLEKEFLNDEAIVAGADKHRLPFDGVLDWKKIAEWISKAPILLPADMEVCLQYGKLFNDDEKELEVLLQARKCSEKLHGMIEEFKREDH